MLGLMSMLIAMETPVIDYNVNRFVFMNAKEFRTLVNLCVASGGLKQETKDVSRKDKGALVLEPQAELKEHFDGIKTMVDYQIDRVLQRYLAAQIVAEKGFTSDTMTREFKQNDDFLFDSKLGFVLRMEIPVEKDKVEESA